MKPFISVAQIDHARLFTFAQLMLISFLCLRQVKSVHVEFNNYFATMPLAFGADIVEGKVYRSKRKQDEDDEKSALKELQTILTKKNRTPCDCGAQQHELVENCMTCGRLTCEAEGPGKCLSCGSIILDAEQRAKLSKYIDIEQSTPSSSSSNRASTSRAKVVDNQFDFFALDKKKHLKESDKKMLEATLKELQAKRYQRKMVFNVDVDNLEAGAQSAPLIDDYEAELRLLQLTDSSGPQESNFTLAELVGQELKRNYVLEYVELTKDQQRKLQQQQLHSQDKEKAAASSSTQQGNSNPSGSLTSQQRQDQNSKNDSKVKSFERVHKSKQVKANNHNRFARANKAAQKQQSAWTKGNNNKRTK